MPVNQDGDLFRYQFDTSDPFKANVKNKGSLSYVDLDVRGVREGKIKVEGIAAIINRILLYFASGPGDFGRRDIGNEFAFVFSSPVNRITQLRIMTTCMSVMQRRFPELTVQDVNVSVVDRTQRGGGVSKGWNVTLIVRHISITEDIRIDIPLDDRSLIPRAADYIQV